MVFTMQTHSWDWSTRLQVKILWNCDLLSVDVKMYILNIFVWLFFFQNAAVLPQVLVRNGKNMYRFVHLLRKFAKNKKVSVEDCESWLAHTVLICPMTCFCWQLKERFCCGYVNIVPFYYVGTKILVLLICSFFVRLSVLNALMSIITGISNFNICVYEWVPQTNDFFP